MQQQHIKPKGIYAVLNGAASNYRFVKEFPEAAQYVIDTNHWYDPRNATALALKKEVDGMGKFFTYNVALNYSAMLLLADAIERAASADRKKIIDGARGLDLRQAHHALWSDASSSTVRTPARRRSTRRCRTATSK